MGRLCSNCKQSSTGVNAPLLHYNLNTGWVILLSLNTPAQVWVHCCYTTTHWMSFQIYTLFSSASSSFHCFIRARDSPHLGTLLVAERKTHMKEVLGQSDYQSQTACRWRKMQKSTAHTNTPHSSGLHACTFTMQVQYSPNSTTSLVAEKKRTCPFGQWLHEDRMEMYLIVYGTVHRKH